MLSSQKFYSLATIFHLLLPKAKLVAIDISPEALTVARENAARLNRAGRVEFRLGDLLTPLADMRPDLIVSNPPYIPSQDIASLEAGVRDHEPRLALDGGADGLEAYRAIAAEALEHLEDHGLVGLEIGFDQRDDVTQIFEEAGFSLLEERRDYGGNDRVLVFAPKLN